MYSSWLTERQENAGWKKVKVEKSGQNIQKVLQLGVIMSQIRQDYAGSDEHIIEMADLSMKRPDDYAYFGQIDLHNSWGFAGIDLSRDANCLDKANFQAFHRDIVEKYPDDFTVENFGHWAVGSIDRTLVRVLKDQHEGVEVENITDAFITTLEILEALQDYCVLDDGLLCDAEHKKLIENIEWYCTQFKADEINQNGAEWVEDILSKLYEMEVELCPDAELYPTEEELEEAAKELGIWNGVDIE